METLDLLNRSNIVITKKIKKMTNTVDPKLIRLMKNGQINFVPTSVRKNFNAQVALAFKRKESKIAVRH